MTNAPKLINKKPNSTNFYALDQAVMDAVFEGLSGKEGNQIKLMTVLIGTKDGFGISEAWLLERTDMLHGPYINARKALIEKGWITLDPQKTITVNYDVILGNMTLPKGKDATGNVTLPSEKSITSNVILLDEESITGNVTLPNTGNVILPERGNVILPDPGNVTLPIIDNRTDKITDNRIDNTPNPNKGRWPLLEQFNF